MYPLTASAVELFGRPLPSCLAERVDLYVRVHEQVPKSVVFIGVENAGRFMPIGTGFLGGHSYRGYEFTYLITADHLRGMIAGDRLWVRINRKVGDASTFSLSKDDCHRDEANDIAIFPLPSPHDAFDQKLIYFNREAHEKHIAIWSPDIGDEVATVGLYTTHQGETKNIPIVRIGNIARMPNEPVRSTRGEAVAYLIEIRSIVGLSGSPVYLNLPRIYIDEKGVPRFRTGSGVQAFPIGMMLGYHLVSSKEDQIQVPLADTRESGAGAPLTADEKNTGMAVVIPFERILDVIEREKARKAMDAGIEYRLNETKVRPAGVPLAEGPAEPSNETNLSHREDFTRLLNAAAKTPPQDE